jgi:DNA-binding winged helix-turn-helix (wHTH) protein/TolB-like protein
MSRVAHPGSEAVLTAPEPVDAARVRAPRGERLQIGDWLVEPALDRASTARKTVKLEPKAMSVLVHLADHAGQVVSRDALLQAAWPGLVVGDDSLTQVILKLRKALGDAPDKPAYIQTIAKRGYRLVAPVRRSTGPTLDGQPAGPSQPRPRVRVAAIAAAGMAAVLIAAAGIAWVDRERAAGGASHASMADAAMARAGQPTLVITPFEPVGDDPKAAVLAQGLTADLLTDFAKVSGLSVIGAVARDVASGGDTSGDGSQVRYVVSGTVQRVDDRLRLQVHLANATTGEELWSERFDRPLSGLFAMQEELGPKILQILPAKVSEAELRRVSRRYTRNLQAYEYFQRAQSALLTREHEQNDTARDLYRRAIALDPGFARAYAGLALTYAADYRNRWTADGAAALDRAFATAHTAYAMDPDIAETYWAMAFVHVERRQHDEALRYLATAVRLFPSYADAYALMGGVYTYLGRPAETLPLLHAAMRLDPRPGYLYYLLLGRAYLLLGDLDQARVNLQHALLGNPADVELHVYLAALYVAAGDKAAADWEAQEVRALRPGFSADAWLSTYPMTDVAQRETLAHALHVIGF